MKKLPSCRMKMTPASPTVEARDGILLAAAINADDTDFVIFNAAQNGT
jgi:hypothetical protein